MKKRSASGSKIADPVKATPLDNNDGDVSVPAQVRSKQARVAVSNDESGTARLERARTIPASSLAVYLQRLLRALSDADVVAFIDRELLVFDGDNAPLQVKDRLENVRRVVSAIHETLLRHSTFRDYDDLLAAQIVHRHDPKVDAAVAALREFWRKVIEAYGCLCRCSKLRFFAVALSMYVVQAEEDS
jgi:hypothetical protein